MNPVATASFRPRASVVALATACALSLPTAAVACGGLFCNGGTAPVPVEQTGERILFEVDAELGTVSTTVDIAYTGDPVDFAWVVPVPATPSLDIVPEQVLATLDGATVPQLLNQPTWCSADSDWGRWGCSTGTSTRLATAVAAAPLAVLGCAAPGRDDEEPDPVQVERIPRVGPYDPTVVSSEDPAALIEWLQTEGYFISEAMEPYVAQYVASGSRFLAMKLAPDVGVSDIAPIRMTYEGTEPQIPLVLTAVAAEPEMSILAFVAADSRYEAANYANLAMDPAWIRRDPFTGVDNYEAVVSFLADGLGGKAFVTAYSGELASLPWLGDGDEERAWLNELAERAPTVTRLYTRMSAWEMTEDPVFRPSGGDPVSAALDLSGNTPVDLCEDAKEVGVCGDAYCGPGALCARTPLGQACACPDGWAAREIAGVGVNARPQVTCQRLDHALYTGADLDPKQGSEGVCLPDMCGDDGACVDLNGFPTCLCDEGFAAAVGTDGAPRCSPVLDLFTPEEALVHGDLSTGFAAVDDDGDSSEIGLMMLLAALLGPGIVRARRRRRRA
jgi:hypothetical protein